MRIPYTENPPNFANEDDKAVLERVQKRRGEKGLIELDLALLHSPPVADGWNAFLGAIRTRTTLPPSILELAISRVAVLNHAWYEWSAHAPLLRQAPGMTDEHVKAVLDTPGHQNNSIFDERHAAVMAYADAMTLKVDVADEIMESLKKQFSEKEVVEVTATVAAYNCVSRFLVALDVGERNGRAGKWPLE